MPGHADIGDACTLPRNYSGKPWLVSAHNKSDRQIVSSQDTSGDSQRLVSVADPSERKTLSAEVLVDPARFEEF
jgi:hypothetical protein